MVVGTVLVQGSGGDIGSAVSAVSPTVSRELRFFSLAQI